MKHQAAILLLCSVALSASAQAPDKGYWRATSNTARSITGDLSLGEEKIGINFVAFTMAHIRTLEKSEVSAVFDAEDASGVGTLYRLNIPGARKFLNKNTLCGNEDVQWMVTYAYARSLRVAFFSSSTAPILKLEAISNSTDLCGTFAYSR